MELASELAALLQQDTRFYANDQLLKNQVMEHALKLDRALLRLLLSHDRLKAHFFVDVEGVLVFDRDKFIRFVNNKAFLPDSYTSFKNKIGLATADGRYLQENRDVVLVWPYKDCVLEGGQTKEEQKREEIFWNETLAPDDVDRLLAPKLLTNWRRYDADGSHDVTELQATDNLIIKGNNLLALASLKKRFAGKVKLIYIDPPYNTGSDSFHYNDKFNHSTWLTFLKNRLETAKGLLGKDGIICVQCDDNEQAYLKVLMDEVFGIDNNRAIIYIETVYADKTLKQDRVFHDQIEQLLIYSSSERSTIIQEYEDYNYDKFQWYIHEKKAQRKVIELGEKRIEIFDKDSYTITKGKASVEGLKEIWASGTILDINSSGRFFRDHLMNRVDIDGYGTLYKVYGIGNDLNDYRYFTGPKKPGATKGKYYQGVPTDKVDADLVSAQKKSIENFWPMAADFGNCRSEGGVELKSGKKPEKLLQRIIEMTTKKGDIVVDFFVGSGTTTAAAHKMGRQYIGIEQLDYGENDSTVRLCNVIKGDQTGISKAVDWQGGGSFVYAELMQWNEQFIPRIQAAADKESLQAIWSDMQEKAHLSYRLNLKAFNANAAAFADLSLEDQRRFLLEVLDKNQLYVPYSERDDALYAVSDADKALNRQFYGE